VQSVPNKSIILIGMFAFTRTQKKGNTFLEPGVTPRHYLGDPKAATSVPTREVQLLFEIK
jgi:hypothetical protein